MGGDPVGKADSRALQPAVLIQWTLCMVVRKQMIQIQVFTHHTRRNTEVGNPVFTYSSSWVSSYISYLIVANLEMLPSLLGKYMRDQAFMMSQRAEHRP